MGAITAWRRLHNSQGQCRKAILERAQRHARRRRPVPRPSSLEKRASFGGRIFTRFVSFCRAACEIAKAQRPRQNEAKRDRTRQANEYVSPSEPWGSTMLSPDWFNDSDQALL